MTHATTTDRVRMTVAEARALGEAAMRGAGFDDDDARILTDHVLDAALCGYEYSGLPKLLNVVDEPRFGQPRRPVTVIRETGAAALVDGGNNNGMIAAYRACEVTIARAAANGLALVCLANTSMTGRSAYYCEMIARAGLAVIHTVASPPSVAPFGGTRPALGTNPVAFGFPTEGDPLVIDMGTSAFMGTDLQFRARLGTPIPDGVALGPNGHPTTDANAARRGALLPFGGYMFIAFKPDLFLPIEDYRREVTRRIDTIKATPRQEGVEEIRIPGERAYRTRARLLAEGIEIDRKIHAALGRLAEGKRDHGA